MRKNDLSFKMSLSRPVRVVTWISSALILLGVAVCAYPLPWWRAAVGFSG